MSSDLEAEEFAKALRKLPRQVDCFSNGAVCPWCGWLHETITFGNNECGNCSHQYRFGYPEWHEGKDGPVSWVPFPWKEWEAFKRADLIENWSPNKRLQEIYFQQAEENIGRWADPTKPN